MAAAPNATSNATGLLNPMFFDSCNIPSTALNQTALTDVISLFLPQGGPPDATLIGVDNFIIFHENYANMSLTFVSSYAGNTNRAGFAIYNATTHSLVTGLTRAYGQAIPNNDVFGRFVAFPATVPNSGVGCLIFGDTFKFGPFMNGDMLIFYLEQDAGNTTLNWAIPPPRFWSYIDYVGLSESPPVGIGNPDSCSSGVALGCPHTVQVQLADFDNIVLWGLKMVVLLRAMLRVVIRMWPLVMQATTI